VIVRFKRIWPYLWSLLGFLRILLLMMIDANGVLDFWFDEINPSQWFESNNVLDFKVKQRFGKCLETASKGELYQWRATAKGRLAEIIVLDQFSRNIFRGEAEAFANDSMALVLAQELTFNHLDLTLPILQRAFAYLPFMHSESKIIHEAALKLFSIPGLENNLKYEILHKNIIDQFGRYPHRNHILGRVSTPEELEFLKHHEGF
jgi:uncharacterized protein (DUF924 family)